MCVHGGSGDDGGDGGGDGVVVQLYFTVVFDLFMIKHDLSLCC